MPVTWLSKKWCALLGAACLAACFFNPAGALAGEEAPAAAGQPPPPATSPTAPGTDPPAAPPGEAVWEKSPQQPAPEAAPAAQEQKAADAPAPPADRERKAADAAAPAEGGQGKAAVLGDSPGQGALPPVFALQGLTIGMDLGEAKEALNRLLGVEAASQPDPVGGGQQLGVDGYAVVTLDRNQQVVRIEFLQNLIDALYETGGLKPQDFAGKFSARHGIALDIDVTRRHTAWQGLTPDGLTVTITSTDTDDKVLSLEKR